MIRLVEPAPQPAPIATDGGHRFNMGTLVCETCSMPRYLFATGKRPDCGTAEAHRLMERYTAALGRMGDGA